MRRAPPQLTPRPGRTRHQDRRVTRPARSVKDLYRGASDLYTDLDDLQVGEPALVAEIEDPVLSVPLQPLQCEPVCLGQFRDVDVVTNARSVGRGVVVAEDLETSLPRR